MKNLIKLIQLFNNSSMKKEIQENNKLIAEFMEYNLKSYLTKYDYLYHRSWDWLMPVVEKIESMDKVTSFQIDKTVEPFACHAVIVDGYKGLEIITDSDNKFKAIYEAVIEFIKWHNKL